MIGLLALLVPLAVIGGIVAAIVVAVRRRQPGEEFSPKHLFMYLLAMVTLYLSAAGVLMLIWGLAEVWFPDPALGFDYGGDSGPVRAGISMAVVAFPIFLYLAAQVRRRSRSGEIPAGSALRSAFVYTNLFVVTLAAVITLMVSVNAFLNGDLTPRFGVRAGGVLLIAGVLYLYYRSELDSGAAGETKPEVSG